MQWQKEKEEIQYHINRCGFDFDLVVFYLDDGDEGKGIFSDLRIADDHWCTVDLNIDETLANLRQLEDSCSYEQFLDAIVDSAD